MTGVTLPDGSQVNYAYQHSIFTYTNHGRLATSDYSTHLLVEEDKQNGRVLKNNYNTNRQVIAQSAAVGTDLTPIQNATFQYLGAATGTNGFISGTTLVTDINGYTTTYGYTNGLITNIIDALGHTNSFVWYQAIDTNLPGYFPRSTRQTVDRRGLVTTYMYDARGNITNCAYKGNLAGTNSANDLAVLQFTFNTNSVLTGSIDSDGNAIQYVYGATYPRLPTNIVYSYSNSAAVTNIVYYGATTNSATNLAYGLSSFAAGVPIQTVVAFGSPDSATNQMSYDSRGYVLSTTNYSGTADPNVVMTFGHDNYGNLTWQMDSAGRVTAFTYDIMGRKESREVFDTGADVPMLTEFWYYNENGEVTWYDGPRSNPEDYVWYDYDGAGRKIEEIHWRSEAVADGSGVQAATGDDLYATMFYGYDGFGNLMNVADQHGNTTRMVYDGMGQMLLRLVFSPSNAIPIRSEGFSYEPGGLVSVYTNANLGITSNSYTMFGELQSCLHPDGSYNSWTYLIDGRTNRMYLANGSYWQFNYDDLHRVKGRALYSSSGALLESMTNIYDRRGNMVTNIDADGNVFTSAYDGLNRAKTNSGPVVSTNQQISVHVYDATGQKIQIRNGLGEAVTVFYDALGRVTGKTVADQSGGDVSIMTNYYSGDFNSVTSISGTNGNPVKTTTFTDTFGKTVVVQKYPSSGASNYVYSVANYDVLGDLVLSRDELGQATSYGYDALNRMTTKTLPDAKSISFSYDGLGNITQSLMPGGLTWTSTYDQTGRRTSEYVSGTNGATNRNFVYSYYGTGPVGMPQTVVDEGRGVTVSNAYDAYMRLVSSAATGAAPYQNETNSYVYDAKGLLLSTTESSATASTSIARAYDGYGQLTNESVFINGIQQSDFAQNWNSAGRRTLLQEVEGDSVPIIQQYRADGLLTNVFQSANNYSFAYDSAGFLASRSNPFRTLEISRDGIGRITQQSNFLGGSNVFTESVTWRANSTIGNYAASRAGAGAWNDNRTYQYNNRNQLVSEPVAVSNSIASSATYTYGFDPGGIGVRVSAQLTNSLTNLWQSILDPFDRLNSQQWTQSGLTLLASGSAFYANTVAITNNGTNIGSVTPVDNRWSTNISFLPGTNRLVATATFTNGQSSASASSTFVISSSNSVLEQYDGAGFVTNRTFVNSNKTQVLTWDGFGRLVGIVERDSFTNGFNWSSLYDPLGRRLRTITVPVTNAVTNAFAEIVVDSYYDPMVEFQEIGVGINGDRTWKVLGPDLNGRYGAANGVGGVEATIYESDGFTTSVMNDIVGNSLATYSPAGFSWSPIRVSSYGVVSGYKSPIYGAGTSLAQALIWRGRACDPSGLYLLGTRYYDQNAGHFVSPDPKGHAAAMDLYSFCNGDPLNAFDSDGRLGKYAYAGIAGVINTVDGLAVSPFAVIEGSLRALLKPAAYSWYYGFSSAWATLDRGFLSFGRAYNVAENASLLQLLPLIGNQIPFLGTFIPGPQGPTDGTVSATITSRGIAGPDSSGVMNLDARAGNNLHLNDQQSAPYVGGSIMEVFAEAFLGDTAPGLEYASQVAAAISQGSTIDQVDHSGGVLRGLEGSRYLGYYGIGVDKNFSSQGPALGYYNNIANMELRLSPSYWFFGEFTSTISWATQKLMFSEGDLDVDSAWTGAKHLQPGLNSYWDATAATFLQH